MQDDRFRISDGQPVIGIFDDLVGLFCIFIGDIKFFGCTVCFNSAIVCKKCHVFSPSHTPYSNRRLLGYFQTKTLPLNSG